MAPQFVDISSFQGTINWVAYREWAAQWDGIARVAMKATEGVGFTDPQFGANRAGALAAGIDTILYYHFARPDLGNAPYAEANWMKTVVGAIRPTDRIMLDYEQESTQSSPEWAYEWLVSQRNVYGDKVGIYSYGVFIAEHLQSPELAQFPLWLAIWTQDPNARPASPSPWTAYEAIQYTDKATNIPGIQGNVDCNVFIGGQSVNQYGPNSADFNAYFTANDDNHWTCKNGFVVQFGNLALYSQLSLNGSLPIIGLPIESEQYHTETDGYAWSSQQFERATIIYDPAHRFDNQPGMGESYLAHQPTQTQIVEKIPDDLDQAGKQIGAFVGIAKKYGWL